MAKQKMKISANVAKGMAVAGLVGVFGGLSYMIYSFGKSGETYPQLVEIDEKKENLKKKYSEECIQPYDESKCDGLRRQYGLLLEEKAQIQQTEDYQTFMEERKIIFERGFIYSGLTMSGSLFLHSIGFSLYTHRKEEEFDEKAKKRDLLAQKEVE